MNNEELLKQAFIDAALLDIEERGPEAVHPKILEKLLQLGRLIEDPTGTFLIPGDAVHCPGNGKHVDSNGEPIEICCDGCEGVYRCFPEWLPGGSACNFEPTKRMEKQIQELVEQHGLCEAYAFVQNRIIHEQNEWPVNINHEQIANDLLLLDKLAHLVAKFALEQKGWDFSKHSEGDPPDWMFDPFGIMKEQQGEE